ncbi:hypothetical protein VOLCADRAFT_90419 [Volvox carteri f. nagariensis]|uniref:Citrate transporter-like domain-containing protein n=1 Tax=Volvox carteri f. nagariensis TaxID=3068 RepID=D8TUB6_VOLCA|nr:uncharacterized protein VOLCADRAFT_90419 [Volvox carteri f. nagariensis]EFJ49011.1 hypothetical protein VOLCADRAFT_90419 [Volvox carteri f. nagariensis]|eukprot:XP_002949908.1 hypothetical protein VOLCADRAFT_90419 [Volvox carteri f. nagariensis]
MKTPFHGALSLLVFLLTIICTYALAPQGASLHIPRTRWSVPISFCWIPWFATGLLLLFQALSFKEVGAALVGEGSLRPSSIIVTYMSLAYLAVSCEITGLYSWLALHAARWSRGKPVLLLAVFFALSGALTAAIGPDVSLVALTPVAIYTAGAANLDPMAMAATHLGSVSLWGMLVPVAGPINILTSHAFQLTFMRFLGWMALPTCAAAVVMFGLLYVLLHRSRVAALAARCDPVTATTVAAAAATLPYPDPGVMLHDQVGAACSSALLAGCLLALLVAPWLRWSGELVAAVFAAVAAIYNLVAGGGGPLPLRVAIGRRSAYERRRRLQAELARQGHQWVVSDEDLADLLLSAAHNRQASLTRLAAATANRVTASATYSTAAAAAAIGGGGGASIHRRPSSGCDGSVRADGGGGGCGVRFSSTGTGITSCGSLSRHSLTSLASLGAGGGSGGGGDGGLPSPVRRWFSRRWSSFRGFLLPPAAGCELLEAAAEARADLGMLAEYGAAAGSTVATQAWNGRPDGAAAAAAGAGSSSSKGPSLHSWMSLELQHLLTHGTAAVPSDSLEWWAAAASAAQGMLWTEPGSLAEAALLSQSVGTYQGGGGDLLVADAGDEVRNGGGATTCSGIGGGGGWRWISSSAGTVDGVGGAAGGCGARRRRSLTAQSPFANAAAMASSDWDGCPAIASACGAAADVATTTVTADANPDDGVRQAAVIDGHRRQQSCEDVSAVVQRTPGAARSQAGLRTSADDPWDARGAADGGRDGNVGVDGSCGQEVGSGREQEPPSSGPDTASRILRAVSLEGGYGRGGAATAAAVAAAATVADPAGSVLSLHRQPSSHPLQTSPLHPQSPPRLSYGGGYHGGNDERYALTIMAPPPADRDAAGSPAAARLLPLPPPLQRRQTLPSALGFEGLFGCWRRGTVHQGGTAAESAALLPACAAASDDPCHTALRPLPLPVPPAAGQTAAAGKTEPTEDEAKWPHRISVHAFHINRHLNSSSSLGGGLDDNASGYNKSPAVTAMATAPSPRSTYKLRRPSVALLLLGSREVSFLGTFTALPWANIVLMLGWFVLVEAMQVHGWLDALARCLTAIVDAKDPLQLSSSSSPSSPSSPSYSTDDVTVIRTAAATPASVVAGAVFAIGWLSVLLSIGMTGQSTALLLARVIMRPEFLQLLVPQYQQQQQQQQQLLQLQQQQLQVSASGSTALTNTSSIADTGTATATFSDLGRNGFGASAHRGAQLALVVAANLAPALSLSGSLTALRWGLGLREMGVRMRCCKILVSGLAPAALAGMAVALLVLWIQCIVWQ